MTTAAQQQQIAMRNRLQGRVAFERLNEAHRILLDPGKRSVEVTRRVAEAKRRTALKEASATGDERIALNAAKTEQV